MRIWQIMIILHATSAIVCFTAGNLALSLQLARKHTWLIPTFLIALAGMIVFMAGAMASHWYDITTTERIVFSGLVVLGLYMFYRGRQAWTAIRQPKVPANYTDHVGFNLIALFNGFTIVALIDLKAPGWLVATGAIGAVIVGGRLVGMAKKRNLSLKISE